MIFCVVSNLQASCFSSLSVGIKSVNHCDWLDFNFDEILFMVSLFSVESK